MAIGTLEILTQNIFRKDILIKKIFFQNIDFEVFFIAVKYTRPLAKKVMCHTNQGTIGLLTANVFSRLYYGSQVWLLPNLKEKLFKKLFSHSGQILKMIDKDLSYMSLHKKFNRSPPKIFSIYQTAINLFHAKNNIPQGHQVE